MKKRILLVLLTTSLMLAALTGCNAGRNDWGQDHIWYYHDEVHEVGIWVIDSAGKFGGRHIFVLPDNQYSNPGSEISFAPSR